MIRVILDGLVKRHGRVSAVDRASLEIRPRELTFVVGPADAGKTTLARLIAGLETPDDGEIYFDDRIVHAVPAEERRVALVVRDGALWPGLSAGENVGYPLKLRKEPRASRRARVAEMLTSMRIDSLAEKRPDQLSPSQRLRVALARALVTAPELLILDEPFEPFDARTAEEFRDDLRRIQIDHDVTTLVLTRNAREALSVADRLAVMDLGKIVQVGPPDDVYNHPADAFVARYLGPINLLQGQVDAHESSIKGEVVVRTPLGRLVGRSTANSLTAGTPVTIAIRPETSLPRAGDSLRLEPVSCDSRAARLSRRASTNPSPRTWRLACHRPGLAKPVGPGPRRPGADALRSTGIRRRPARQVFRPGPARLLISVSFVFAHDVDVAMSPFGAQAKFRAEPVERSRAVETDVGGIFLVVPGPESCPGDDQFRHDA